MPYGGDFFAGGVFFLRYCNDFGGGGKTEVLR